MSIFISNLCILGMLTYLGISFFSLRYQDKRIQVSLFLISCVIGSVSYWLPSYEFVWLCVIETIYFFIMFEWKQWKSVMVVVLFPFIIILSQYFTAQILETIRNYHYNTENNIYWFTYANVLSNLVTFVILFAFIHLSKLFMKVKVPSFTWMIFVLPISSFVLLLKINEISYSFIRDNRLLFFAVIGILISNVIVFYIFYKVVASFEFKQELERANHREKMANLKYDLMKDRYDMNFSFLHELLNTCNELNGYLIHKDYDNARERLNLLYANSYKGFNAIHSNSIILNYLIVERLEVLEKHHITIKSVVEYNDFHFLSMEEQHLLFASLLDYAINEAKQVQGSKTLIFKTHQKGYQIIMQVIFSSNQVKVHMENEIKEVLEKHDALISETLDKVNRVKNVIIVFPYMKNE